MLKYKGYLAKVQYDDEAKLLHGEVIGIRDVVTFQADSASAIPKAFRESVDDYLEFCRSRGEKPNKPASGKFVVRIDPELHRKLSMLAESEDKSLNAIVEEFLADEAERKLEMA